MKQKELSQRRKEQMAAALKKLMTRKELQKITIQDIADECGMNRYTFYYHFQDIYDLLSWGLCRDFHLLFENRSNCSTLDEWIQVLIEYLKENKAVCKCALNSMGLVPFRKICMDTLLGLIQSLLKELCQKDLPEDFLNFLSYFYLEAVIGVMVQWVLDDLPIPEEKLVSYLHLSLEGTLAFVLSQFKA